ncbi:MAG: carbohydrate kinase [Thermoplasmata archaeon]|uniref:Carbohydrate kinase n=1 Tax=Candidatus Sysuiplasma superficiale TaxID=2823368 RepID=A0A8J7YSZ0_9ARCH|nr:carbohydrate kinase [Candidatus Sysuiplasma superficiale]MBX8643987.1 carbohydrate kinase [Candidatus Sysuiplasma superficiale]
MNSVICSGEAIIDMIQKRRAPNKLIFEAHPGGAPANVAGGIGKLGGSARFFGKVSTDIFGKLILDTLGRNNVDLRFVPPLSSKPTAISLVSLDRSGNRDFVFHHCSTADSELGSEEITGDLFAGASICHVGSFALSERRSGKATVSLIERAVSENCLISCDINVREQLWKSRRQLSRALRYLHGRSDILKCSLEEMHYLDSDFDTAHLHGSGNSILLERIQKSSARILSEGVRLLVVTMGSNGSILFSVRASAFVPSFQIRAVDTTGAGDSFLAAVLYKLTSKGWDNRASLNRLGKMDLGEIGRFASAVSAISCTRHGGIESFPFMHEVEKFLSSRN